MQLSLSVYGEISKKTTQLNIKESDLSLNLIEFLFNNQIPIASSCRGEGICKKCLINKDLLCCDYTVSQWLETNQRIEISYI